MFNTLILSGGSGSRLWPLSRHDMPKQFLPLFNNRTLFDLTLERFSQIGMRKTVVANHSHISLLSDFSDDQSLEIIFEDVQKNTAFAMFVGLQKFHDDDIVLVTPSDHFIKNVSSLLQSIESGISEVNKGNLVTFGIEPTYPNTGYGYLIPLDSYEELPVILSVRAEEKPSFERAINLLDSKKSFWNSGIFLGKKSTFISLFKKFAPEYFSFNLSFNHIDDNNYKLVGDFESITPISFDKKVLEFLSDFKMVPLNCGWSDVGGWQALIEILSLEFSFNNINVLNNSNNCLIYSPSKIVVLNGVNDLLIVDMQDVIFVSDRNNLESIRNLHSLLEKISPDLLFSSNPLYKL